MSFASGFFGTMANNMQDKRQFIRARVEEDRRYLKEQGLKRQSAINEQRDIYQQAAKELIRRSGDERAVLGMLENDPGGLLQVYKSSDGLSAAALNGMFNVADEYSGEATLDEIIQRILPTAKAIPEGTDPVTARRKTLASFLGLDTETELNEEVYNAQIVGGMTGNDILASMNLPVSAQGVNEGLVSYNLDPPVKSEESKPLSAGDQSDYIDMANSDYDIVSRVEQLKAGLTETDEEGNLIVTQEEVEAVQEQIAELERIDGLSSLARLNAILKSPLFEVGPNTAGLAQRLGGRLFDPANGFDALGLDKLFGTTEEAMGEEGSSTRPQARPEGLGGPAVEPEAEPIVESTSTPDTEEPTTQEPSVNTPAIDVTPENVEEFTNSWFTMYPESKGVIVKFPGGAPVTIPPEMVTGQGDPSILESFLPEIPRRGNRGGTITPDLETYEAQPTYGGGGRGRARDRKLFLDTAFSSEPVSPEELERVIAEFVDKYGEEEAQYILDNPDEVRLETLQALGRDTRMSQELNQSIQRSVTPTDPRLERTNG